MATWTIVKFASDNSIEAVPTIWLDGNTCSWPRYDVSKLNKAIRNCDPVLPSWDTHQVISFRNATYGDYAIARKKCQKAEVTSDLNSDDNTRRRRVPKILDTSSSNGTRSSSDSECNKSVTLEKPKKLTLNRNFKKELPKCPSFSLMKDSIASEAKSLKHRSNENKGLLQYLEDNEANNNSRQYTTSVLKETKAGDPVGKCTNKGNEEYFKQILRKLSLLEIMVSDLQSQIKTITSNRSPEETTFNIWECLLLPVDNEQDLDKLEDFLKEIENMQKSVDELAKIGGDTTDEFVRRSFKKMMTNKIQAKFSWLGKKEKKNFSALHLSKLIKNAAWKNQSTKLATEKDIEGSIQKYIKRAKERAEAETKKK